MDNISFVQNMAREQSMNRFNDCDEDELNDYNYIKKKWNKNSSENSLIDSSNNSSRNTSREKETCTSADELDDARVRPRNKREKSSVSLTVVNYKVTHKSTDGELTLKYGFMKRLQMSTRNNQNIHDKMPINDHRKFRSKNKMYLQIGSIIIVIAILIYCCCALNEPINEDIKVDGNRKRCNVFRLVSEFPNQRNPIWKALKFGIETTINDDPTKPSIYLFVYNDPVTVSRFTSAVIRLTRNCMETRAKPLVLGRDALSSTEMQKDYGVALEKYKPELSNSGVLLVNDLDQVSITNSKN